MSESEAKFLVWAIGAIALAGLVGFLLSMAIELGAGIGRVLVHPYTVAGLAGLAGLHAVALVLRAGNDRRAYEQEGVRQSKWRLDQRVAQAQGVEARAAKMSAAANLADKAARRQEAQAAQAREVADARIRKADADAKRAADAEAALDAKRRLLEKTEARLEQAIADSGLIGHADAFMRNPTEIAFAKFYATQGIEVHFRIPIESPSGSFRPTFVGVLQDGRQFAHQHLVGPEPHRTRVQELRETIIRDAGFVPVFTDDSGNPVDCLQSELNSLLPAPVPEAA